MKKITLFLAGDSTMSYYEPERYPRNGWGQHFSFYFTEAVNVVNMGASGRSTKTFIEEGRLKKIADEIKQGDYLFIQFGHNDSKVNSERYTEPFSTYKQNVLRFIETAREKQAHPVLLTPVQRRNFDKNGKIVDSHGDYVVAMKEVAVEQQTPIIDITSTSTAMLEEMGDELSKKIFMWLQPGEYNYYPKGEQDNTHFTVYGADRIAHLVVKGIKQINLPLVKYLKDELGKGRV